MVGTGLQVILPLQCGVDQSTTVSSVVVYWWVGGDLLAVGCTGGKICWSLWRRTECVSHCVVWSWKLTTAHLLWIAEFLTAAFGWFVYGTASHIPKVVYHISTQVWAHVWTGGVCSQGKALIYVAEASTCLAVLYLSGDVSFWHVCARSVVGPGVTLRI
jgi:hypothetical protein